MSFLSQILLFACKLVTSKPSSKLQDIFEVEPSRASIPAHSHVYAMVTFGPPSMQVRNGGHHVLFSKFIYFCGSQSHLKQGLKPRSARGYKKKMFKMIITQRSWRQELIFLFKQSRTRLKGNMHQARSSTEVQLEWLFVLHLTKHAKTRVFV